jgi:hypothetical protein
MRVAPHPAQAVQQHHRLVPDILLNGHYTFHSEGRLIDLDAMIEGLDLG